MTEADVSSLCALERECFSDPWSERLIRALIESPWDSCMVLENDAGMLIGYANVRVVGNEAELMRICVTGEQRGKGLSHVLLLEGMREMLRRGAEAMTLEVRAGNTAAVRLYEAHGFVLEGVRKNYYSNPDEDAAIYWNRALRYEETRALPMSARGGGSELLPEKKGMGEKDYA